MEFGNLEKIQMHLPSSLSNAISGTSSYRQNSTYMQTIHVYLGTIIVNIYSALTIVRHCSNHRVVLTHGNIVCNSKSLEVTQVPLVRELAK